MKALFVLFAIFTIINAASLKIEEEKVNYEGYKVYKVNIANKEQRAVIHQLATNLELSIWHEDREHIDLMVNPKQQSVFSNLTFARGIENYEMISNLQSLINEEQKSVDSLDNTEFTWTRYHKLPEIETFIDNILSKYSAVAQEFVIGQSYEGRKIRGIKISYKSGNPGIFIEANIHAREWITSATATWFINELLTSSDTNVRNLAENYDWYIVPVLNVDGFVYSHEKDRLWRKTRQPIAHSTCIGTDGNRNFDSYWGIEGGSSTNPCDYDYAGPKAFSEPEIKGLADYLQANKNKLNILIAFHSYSQVLLSPYGHTTEELPENYEDLMKVAKAYADAVGVLPYATKYTYGTSAGSMYLASGATIEYAYNEVDIKITYTVEMRDTGRYGFVLPPVQILPNCEETMTGLMALVKESEQLGYLKLK
ncbi:zinc carboxypeptidase-like [Calliphora vicina]|uniref:zinc carboxypeptidase-like n=1 Tax=Calliphora vicina TaxID=7373 RepID=UPI00325AC29C